MKFLFSLSFVTFKAISIVNAVKGFVLMTQVMFIWTYPVTVSFPEAAYNQGVYVCYIFLVS